MRAPAPPGRPSPLRARRLLRGQRQVDVARAIAVSPMVISMLERGEMELGAPYVARLARHYATAPEQLLAEMARWEVGEARRLLPGQSERGGSGPQAA
jgi:transcriptional regulator with XRE-family HTH domain